MRLVLTWLVGVPVLVLAMVLVRAISPQGLQAAQPRIATASVCAGQDDVHRVAPAVANKRDRAACKRRAVD